MPPTCPHKSYNLAHCMTADEARAVGGHWERGVARLGRDGTMRAREEAVALRTGDLVLAADRMPQPVPPEMEEDVQFTAAAILRARKEQRARIEAQILMRARQHALRVRRP